MYGGDNWNPQWCKPTDIFVHKNMDKLFLKDMALYDDGSTVSGDSMYGGGTDFVPSTQEYVGSLAESFIVLTWDPFIAYLLLFRQTVTTEKKLFMNR